MDGFGSSAVMLLLHRYSYLYNQPLNLIGRLSFLPICLCQSDVFFLSPTPPPTSTSSTCLPGTQVPLLPDTTPAFVHASRDAGGYSIRCCL